MTLYRDFFADRDDIVAPSPHAALTTKRLLTMDWLDGVPLKSFLDAPQETRNRIATLLFQAWWGPMSSIGVIHGDPHLGNYTFGDDARHLNLLDFGCVRIFPARFVQGVVNLYRALDANDMAAVRRAYEDWGFGALSDGAVEALTVPAAALNILAATLGNIVGGSVMVAGVYYVTFRGAPRLPRG